MTTPLLIPRDHRSCTSVTSDVDQVVPLVAVGLSGINAMVAPGGGKRARKYDRPEEGADVDPWDALSDGDDPTER